MSKTYILPESVNLIHRVLELEYGQTISHDEISNIMGLRYGTPKYRSEIQKANKELTLLGKMLKSHKNKGYQIVMPDNYLDMANKKRTEGLKKITKSHVILVNAPTEFMTDEARLKTLEARDRSASFLASVTESSFKLNVFNRPLLNVKSGRA